MKTHVYLLAVILLGFGCKKESHSSTTTYVSPEAICDAPETEDMSAAKLWGDGTAASCTQQALQTLIDAGGKIIFNGGSSAFTLRLSATLVVPNKEVIIDGKGLLTIDGQGSYRIFDKLSAASQAEGTLFVLQNMTLTNGKAALKSDERGGAAIYGRAYGSLRMLNINFSNNVGPLSASDDCGAVHTIVYKEALFANCTFTNNKGANGGAVGTIGSAMSFINCTFEGNAATGTGGTFDKGGSGGAIYVDGTDQNGSANNYISICGCTFTNNTSAYQAGAVNVVFYENKGSSLAINKSSFDGNTCAVDKGGACYLMNGDFAVSGCTFSKNTSPVQGGGIWTYNMKGTIENCTFFQNKAVSGSNGLGGAIVLGSSSASITNCTFAENQAGNFASAIFNGSTLSITNNLFYNNRVGDGYQSNPYGGAVINKGSSLAINAGNLQYPADFTGQYGTMNDFWITSTVLTLDAQLGTLADNGGPTLTMSLPKASPAIGKGTSKDAPTTDQRGIARKSPPDIGAYEWVE